MPARTSTQPADLRTYGRILRRRKWWIVLFLVLGVAGASAYAFTAPRQYSASAQVVVQPGVSPLNLASAPPTLNAGEVASQVQVAESPAVRAAATAALKFTPTVGVAQIGTSNVISITATSGNASEAAQIANTYASAFVNYQRQAAVKNLTNAETQLQQQITAIDKQLAGKSNNTPGAIALGNESASLKAKLATLQVDGGEANGGVQIATLAAAPLVPSSPKKALDIGLGLAIGLVLGLAFAFGADALDDSVRSKQDLDEVVPGLPLLGLTPAIERPRKEGPRVWASDPASIAAEAYRSLRSSIELYEQPTRCILVTSPSASDGKTTTVANLGVMVAATGRRVVLVSSELRRPQLCSYFRLDESPGLTSVIDGDRSLDQVLRKVESYPGLSVLGAGPSVPDPAELLGSTKATEIINQLRERFDTVVLDSPPLLPVADAMVLSRLVDLTLLVVSARHTKKEQLLRAYEQLAQANVSQLGIVHNRVSGDSSYGSGYGDRYTSRYAARRDHPDGARDSGGVRQLHNPRDEQSDPSGSEVSSFVT